MDLLKKAWPIMDALRGKVRISSLDVINIYEEWLETGRFNLSVLNSKESADLNELESLLEQLSEDELIQFFYMINQHDRTHELFEFDEGEKLALEIFKHYAETSGTVLDIASGSGHFIRQLHEAGIGSDYHGEELNPNAIKIAEVLSRLSGVKKLDIKETDSLIHWSKDKYDMVYCNMPFLGNIRQEIRRQLAENPEYKLDKIAISDWIFTLRVYAALKEDGVGISIVRGAALNAIRDKEVRKWLVDRKCLKAVIQLPSALMNYTAIPTYMLILTKTENDKIRFIDASGEYVTGATRQKNTFTEDNIGRIMTDLQSGSERTTDVTESDLEKVEYNLHPLVHLKNAENHLINPVPLKELTTQLLRGRDINKQTLDADKDKDKAGYLLNLSDLDDIYIDDIKQPISQELLDANQKVFVKEHDLVITSRGSKIKVAIIDKATADKQVIVSSNITIIRPDTGKVDPHYLLAYMNSEIGHNMIERMNTGSVIFTFTNKKLAEYLVPVLSEEEMNLIADEMKIELADYKRMQRSIKRFKEKLPTIFNKFDKEDY
ncbi:N-6 DNA methylase [Macrococcus bovicus]|uniref:N-6 DNA methylase n=1 Tax=Macrococcus bovicus TaxID=69968 RepID=UPI0025A65E6D|nr:N-6 DNA methylase [Macrococcus bovicus]WJP97400.1 N-6 DNA methylase [Macrococcus bovicus]